MIAIIDYGVGNLFSLNASLKYMNIESEVTKDAQHIRDADKIILPGVGAFKDAYDKLESTGLIPVLDEEVKKGKCLLGICLGMQLLFEKSYEYGEHKGLCYLKGNIYPLRDDIPSNYNVPEIGWNKLFAVKENDPLLKYTDNEPYVYYVHSYYARADVDSLAAYSEYGVKVSGYVHKDNVFGTQFHPEKSGRDGLNILKAFDEID